MTDIDTQNRFIGLRAEGWRFDRIAQELGVSKPTLINWSRKHQFEIQNQRAILLEALKERWLSDGQTRVNVLGDQLKEVEAEAREPQHLRTEYTPAFLPGRFPPPPNPKGNWHHDLLLSRQRDSRNEFVPEVQDWNP